MSAVLLVPGGGLSLQRAVERVADVDVATRSWVWSLRLLIHSSFVTAIESGVDRLFQDDSVLDVVLLFLVIILTGSWCLGIGLSCVRSLAFVLPELSSFGLDEERLGLLSDELAIRIRSQMVVGLFLNRNHGFIGTWSRGFRLLFGVLAVWDFALEDLVLAGGVELLLTLLFEVVDARSWVLGPAQVVVSHVVLREQFPVDLAVCEVVDGCLWLDGGLFGVVGSWAHLVAAVPVDGADVVGKRSTSVGGGCQLLRWDTRSMGIRNNCQGGVLVLLVFEEGLVEILQIVPLLLLVILTGVWILLIGGPLDKSRSWRSWAKSWNLGCKGIVHFILNLWNDFSFLTRITSSAWIRIECITHGSILGCMERSGSVFLVVKLRSISLVVNTWTDICRSIILPKFSLSLCSLQINRHI